MQNMGRLGVWVCLCLASSHAFTLELNAQQGDAAAVPLSNVRLVNQYGEAVRFYDDLIRDRVVLINFMYTTCTNICPLNTAQMSRLYERMGTRMQGNFAMLSISIDPQTDDPERLHQYWQAFGAKPGWQFLTGDEADIERLRRDLGVYDLDPVVDADKSQHAGIVTIGNDRSGRWMALPIMMDLKQLAMTILRNVRERPWRQVNAVARDGST